MLRLFIYSLLCLIVFSATLCIHKGAESGKKNGISHLSVAFYNLDNLYDDVDDTDHDDNDFTPNGKYQWTADRYHHKLLNMSDVISRMIDGKSPDVFGVCELESAKALKDLLATGELKEKYGFVHYDSPDERGVDVALAYKVDKIEILSSEKIPVVLTKDLLDKTRDQLYVKALVKASKDTLHVYVCHFPSRREGKDESEINRIDAAKTCKNFINSHLNLKQQHLIIIGDFNDEPWDKSINTELGARDIHKSEKVDLLNLMWNFKSKNRGTYKFKDMMNTLDQIIISKSLNDGLGLEYEIGSINIYDADWLKQKGKYNGYPLRTFGGNKWLNGYSDHFAVYMKLKW